jgi:hypothetical protein
MFSELIATEVQSSLFRNRSVEMHSTISDPNDAPDLLLASANADQDTYLESSRAAVNVQLFAATLVAKRSRSNSPEKPVGARFPRQRQSRRCECGICARCRDNARWEIIFNEKFADPAYYGFCVPGFASSLERAISGRDAKRSSSNRSYAD